ncbi:MAG: tetratricopeptide repeat protein [Acinetobacter populi]|jgi:tetratricopeptide (TPR) repeat protein|uniref:tetratricopeptide repeat protein n=1 Tax=Acinetobacter populi TaxID=1582270 RepID=UPI0023570449|nr:tetratricopeptide repeat protein [Acinetobacter populi]MCH4246317.1 tetratricopeptide repeat protein [Acinetobacter populi]
MIKGVISTQKFLNTFLIISGSLLFSSGAFADNINVHVLSATVKDENIANAEIFLQKNGENSQKVISNSQGKATLSSPDADNSDHLLIIKKAGYSTLVTKCPCDGRTYALSPVLQSLDSMRIVLNWGSTPDDLDSHLIYGSNHIYWDAKLAPQANLDVDDTDAYGPETITIDKRLNNQYYVYAVHNYSDRNSNNTKSLSYSDATVRVYVGESLVRTYVVPSNVQGNLWTLFRITPNGEIQDINRISNTPANPVLIPQSVNQFEQNTALALTNVSQASLQRAKTLNLQGDKAYQQGQLEQAILLYQRAIDENPNAAQTYSNIAVVYQKLGRSSEALWANRKSIELASNQNTKAYSHYNIGRIYEQNGRKADALYHYQRANEYKPSDSYRQAIQRVQ